MPLVCPFWSDYVKSIEICPSVDGGAAYFLGSNWDGAAPYFLDGVYGGVSTGGIWSSPSDGSYPSAYSGTPTEVWATSVAPPSFSPWNYGVVVKFFDSVAASGISWSANLVSGVGPLVFDTPSTSLDMAYLRFTMPAQSLAETVVNVIDFTPDGGSPIRLHLKRHTELS